MFSRVPSSLLTEADVVWHFELDLKVTGGGSEGRVVSVMRHAACVSDLSAVYPSLCGVLQISQLGLVVPPREYTSGIHSLM